MNFNICFRHFVSLEMISSEKIFKTVAYKLIVVQSVFPQLLVKLLLDFLLRFSVILSDSYDDNQTYNEWAEAHTTGFNVEKQVRRLAIGISRLFVNHRCHQCTRKIYSVSDTQTMTCVILSVS